VGSARAVQRWAAEERNVSKSVSKTIRFFAALSVLSGCQHAGKVGGPPPAADSAASSTNVAPKPVADPVVGKPMAEPVPFWDHGKAAREIDAAGKLDQGIVLLDLGEEWAPYILTERSRPGDEPVPHTYRSTYLDLAKGKLPTDQKGARVRRDKYL
jgi:hypothetical protein